MSAQATLRSKRDKFKVLICDDIGIGMHHHLAQDGVRVETVRQAIASLPEKYRDAVEIVTPEQLSSREIVLPITRREIPLLPLMEVYPGPAKSGRENRRDRRRRERQNKKRRF